MNRNLTIEQINILTAMKVGANFAADLAHASVTIYIANDNPKLLNIYHQTLPKTQFLGDIPNRSGREVRCNEEPLVQRALQRNTRNFL